MKKLSETQKTVLKAMADGTPLVHFSGWGSVVAPFTRVGTLHVRITTMETLENRGLIKRVKRKYPDTSYGITEQGKEAIRERAE